MRGIEPLDIAAAGLTVSVIDLGASLTSVRAPDAEGEWANVVLAFDDLDDYRDHDRNPHLGAMVGRYANRIGGAEVTVDGVSYRLDANHPPDILHGGADGWSRRFWDVVDVRPDRVTFQLVSPDGDAGFPGEVTARVTYSVGDHTLTIDAEAATTAPTPISMTNHAYWDLRGLGGRSDASSHVVTVDAACHLPVGDRLIPTGEIATVEGTPFDLRGGATPIPELDHCYVLRPGDRAVLSDPSSGRSVTVRTDQPGLQVYAGLHLGPPFVPRGAVCLEPQQLPDAPHHPGFGDVIARPGRPYRFRATYDFSPVGGHTIRDLAP